MLGPAAATVADGVMVGVMILMALKKKKTTITEKTETNDQSKNVITKQRLIVVHFCMVIIGFSRRY